MRQTLVPCSLTFDTSVLAGRVSPSTIAMYSRDFQAYLTYGQEASLEVSTLEQWITHLVQETSMSPNTINRMVSAVKRVISAAAKQGYVSFELAEAFRRVEGVSVGAMKDRMRIRNRVRLSPEVVRAVIESFPSSKLTGLRNRALFLVMASSGLRIKELTTLTLDQIVQRGENYVLIIRAEQGKNLVEDREAHISREAVEAIQTWIALRPVESPYLFTSFGEKGGGKPRATPLTPSGAWKIVRSAFARQGIANVKPHDLRRFVGTQLAKKDIRLTQRALGHKNIATAIKYDLNELEAGLTDQLF